MDPALYFSGENQALIVGVLRERAGDELFALLRAARGPIGAVGVAAEIGATKAAKAEGWEACVEFLQTLARPAQEKENENEDQLTWPK